MQKLIAAPTKVKLNIPQLIFAKLAQSGRHEARGPRVLGSQVQYLLKVTFLLKLFCFSLHKQYKNDDIANFLRTAKLDWVNSGSVSVSVSLSQIHFHLFGVLVTLINYF